MKSLTDQKRRVRDFWNKEPCGTRDNPYVPLSRDYFRWVEQERDRREPFIERFARWSDWRSKKVLEMGTGAGTDFVRFAREGARSFGVDLSERSVALVNQRLKQENLEGTVAVADVENLPFPGEYFDFVYSWGVIHHTEDTTAAVSELLRVLKRGGQFCVMIYHRRSLVCLQAYLLYGLLRGRPFRSIDSIARDHLESFGTKVHSERGARKLFNGQPVRITHVMTPYDLRYARSRYLPDTVGRLLPGYFGYFMVIEGTKQCAE